MHFSPASSLSALPRFLFMWLMLMLAATAPAANQNILGNPDFEESRDGKLTVWSAQELVPANRAYYGRQAACIVNTGKTSRIQQFNLNAGLASWYGNDLKLEYSVVLHSEGKKARVLLYFESISDKYCVSTRVTIPADKCVRLCLRFKVPSKALRQPKIGVALESQGTLLLDNAFLGPENQAPPAAPGDNATFQGNGDTAWKLETLPVKENLLLNSNLQQLNDNGFPKHWNTSAPSAEFTREREFRIFPKEDNGKPWSYEAPAETLSQVAAGSSLRFNVHMTTHGNPSALFVLEAEFLRNGTPVAHYSSGPLSIYVGWETRSFYFTKPTETFDTMRLHIRPQTSGRFTFVSPLLLPGEPPKISLEWKKDAENFARITNFPSRNTWFTRDKLPVALRLQCYLPEDKMKITLREIGGAEVKVEAWDGLPAGTLFERDFVLPALAEGAYEILMESGKMSDYEMFRIRSPQSKGVSFDANNWMILDGKPFFPIALNHVPMHDPDFFRICKNSGINTVAFYYFFAENDFHFKQIKSYLEENQLASIAWNTFANDKRPIADITRDFTAFARRINTLPGFIGFLDDETAVLTKGNYQAARTTTSLYFKAFPDYILWENHAPRIHFEEEKNPGAYFPIVRRYSSVMDVLSCDIYPVPAPGIGHNDLPNRTLSCVGDYTELVNATGWNRKPVWMILQAWGWGEAQGADNLAKMPRPNYHELRFMVYDAIVRGATGIDWHSEGGKEGHGPCNETDSPWWQDFAFVNLELAEVGKMLAGSEPVEKIHTDRGIRGKIWKKNGQLIVIAVNENATSTEIFPCPVKTQLFRAPDATPMPANSTVKLKPYEVAILTSAPIKVLKPAPFTKKQQNRSPLWEKGNWDIPADWVMVGKRTRNSEFIRIPCNLTELPEKVTARISGPGWRLNVNGKEVAVGVDFFYAFDLDLTPYLQKGENSIIVEIVWREGRNKGCAMSITDGEGKILAKTDSASQWSPNGKNDWQPVTNCGPFGPENSVREGRSAKYLIRQSK